MNGGRITRRMANAVCAAGTAVAMAASCTFQERKGAAPAVSGRSFEKVASAPLSYDTVNEIVFRPACVACHAPGGEAARWPLDGYSSAKQHLRRAYHRAVIVGDMPPGGPRLHPCQGALLKRWMDANAPERSSELIGRLAECSPGSEPVGPVPPPEPPQPPGEAMLDYATVRARVFKPNCIDCHGAKGGIGFERYDEASDNARDAYREAVQDGAMPPADSGVPLLTPCQAKILKAWIDAGTPETSTQKLPEFSECGARPPPSRHEP